MAESTLFVFGNGFDLAHGLHTRYSDFFCFLEALNHYAKYHTYNATPEIQSITHPDMAAYLRANLQRNTFPEYCEVISDTLNFGNATKSNIWHSYFLRRWKENLPGVTWIDFEKEIELAIKSIESAKVNTVSELLLHATTLMASRHYHFPPTLSHLASIATPFTDESRGADLKYQCQKALSAFLYEQLMDYAFCFELYLQFFVLDPDRLPEPLPFFDRLFKAKLRKYNPHPDAPAKNSYVLTLNYTDAFERIYHSFEDVHHLHGEIREPSDLTAHMAEPKFQQAVPIVLGFYDSDAASDYKATPFLCFEKFYQRIMKDTGHRVYSWLDNFGTQYDPPLRAIFYGHSLDVTDKDIIRKIFSVATYVDIYCHDPSVKPDYIANLTKILGKDQLSAAYNAQKLNFPPIPPKNK